MCVSVWRCGDLVLCWAYGFMDNMGFVLKFYWLRVRVGTGRVWGKYIILLDIFGFEEMKSIDHPLCGWIGWIG